MPRALFSVVLARYTLFIVVRRNGERVDGVRRSAALDKNARSSLLLTLYKNGCSLSRGRSYFSDICSEQMLGTFVTCRVLPRVLSGSYIVRKTPATTPKIRTCFAGLQIVSTFGFDGIK